MGIKQQGGIFGRNPTFNNVTVDGILTVDQIVEKTGAAGITLDGVTLKDGNVVLTNGKGIDFSATAGTGTSELFDDYEEGTWTPQFTSSAPPTTPISMTITKADYVKVGKLVTATAQINTSSVDLTGASGFLRLAGLPYASASNTRTPVSVAYVLSWGSKYPLHGYVEASATYMTFQYRTAVDGADQFMNITDLSTIAASRNNMMLRVSYLAA